ncbi:carbohydrate kinase family protein [Paenibacillus pini]|uniref:Sugar kinase, ribokinase family n=1 Tax=Paenibacillus pini JCM 16418 TaxID=1236976 RepID=W7YH77_9BACL|nr:carbohydrate kinase family protein [Paenibacillus pini]GAF07822.1 sugar kinase, ribokinase family [Paenibacillus pini JCM 16418]
MRVVVIGELNVDVILSGGDLMPEWNREKLIDSFDIVLGSSSAITACALASIGAKVEFVSIVGDDDFGRLCIRELKRMNVNTDEIKLDTQLKTGVTLSFSTPNDRGLLTYMGTIPLLRPEALPMEKLIAADHVHFGSFYLQEGMRDHWETLFEQLREQGVSTSFDTGWDVHGLWYREKIDRLMAHTDLFIPSEEEITHIYGVELLNEVKALLPEKFNILAVKCGSLGAALYAPGKEPKHVHSFKVTPVDTTGAGDAFNAGLIYAYLSGLRDEDMIKFANACGAISTQGVGGTGSLPTMESIQALMEKGQN